MGEQSAQGGGYRLGVAVDGDHVAGALVDRHGTVVSVIERRLATEPALPEVLNAVVAPLLAEAAVPAAEQIDRVMLAISQIDGLAVFPHAAIPRWRPWLDEAGRVAVLRLGAATTAVPPLAAWPPDIRARVALAEVCVSGGARLDGTEFEPFDADGVADFARDVAGRVAAVAVTGVFCGVTPQHELAAAAILAKELGPSVPIVLSHECGGLGLIERENATALQAALTGSATRGAAWLQSLLMGHGVGHAEMFLARSDGTVMALDYAATHALLLYGGLDAATARGAAALAGDTDALVALSRADGTPRAVCSVVSGRPTLTSGRTSIAGVPTSLRVIALVPVRLACHRDDDPAALDAAALTEAVDRAKDAPADLPLLLAGPGARAMGAALPPRVAGTDGVRCPIWAQAAAAVGVATAPVSGEAERIILVNSVNASENRQAVYDAARATAVRAGADPRLVTVTAVEESPLPYLADPAVLIRVRAEGSPRSGVVQARKAKTTGDGGNPRPLRPAASFGVRDGK